MTTSTTRRDASLGSRLLTVVTGVWGPAVLLAVALAVTVLALIGLGDRAINRLDAAGVILIAGAVAVGIERVIEFFWMAIGLMGRAFWPLTAVHTYVSDATERLDGAVKPLADEAKAGIELLKKMGKQSDAVAHELKNHLESAEQALTDLKRTSGAPGQVQTYAAAAADFVNSVQLKYGVLIASGLRIDALSAANTLARDVGERRLRQSKEAPTQQELTAAGDAELAKLEQQFANKTVAEKGQIAEAYLEANEPLARMAVAGQYAGGVLSSLGDTIASITDNPGRRLLSLEFAALAGLLLAGFLRLDLFAAVLVQPVRNELQSTAFGVIATGIVMGLGSSPTHELVKALQQYKERNKKAAAPTSGGASATIGLGHGEDGAASAPGPQSRSPLGRVEGEELRLFRAKAGETVAIYTPTQQLAPPASEPAPRQPVVHLVRFR